MTSWINGRTDVDPLADVEDLQTAGAKKNFAKVGSGRPSSLLYTYGPGAVMDLPHFTVMPAGFDAWDRVWARRDGVKAIHAPRLLDSVRVQLATPVREIRPFPHQPDVGLFSNEGRDLGVPAIVFPQWFRCTGCDRLAPLTHFEYRNTHPYRPDEAKFEHIDCPGRGSRRNKRYRALALPARYLLACTMGHLDEFPYDGWVHHGKPCPKSQIPHLKMLESTMGRGASATIECASCGAKRGMNEALGAAGQAKLPICRGRHPHLNAFDAAGCQAGTHLMLIGASNLWFPQLQSVIVMPMDPAERNHDLADKLRAALGENLGAFAEVPVVVLRTALAATVPEITDVPDAQLVAALTSALNPATSEDLAQRRESWHPVDLLAPEWKALTLQAGGDHHADEASGLTVRLRERDPHLPHQISRVLAVEKLRQVNALIGFTRIDEMDRVDDLPARRAPLALDAPTWVVGTENRGEGVFLEFDEESIAAWEKTVSNSALWAAHTAAHKRNFENRTSGTATVTDHLSRFQPPRYWLLHTFAHALLREMAMSSGYGAASISERIYAWQGTHREPAAGILLLTTSSDSDGTLGGLVQLSEPAKLNSVVAGALHRARRCSSDPICAHRTPQDPEDFLHGAACHCCSMASETSCERANRFLDRRFLVPLPGEFKDLGFFKDQP